MRATQVVPHDIARLNISLSSPAEPRRSCEAAKTGEGKGTQVVGTNSNPPVMLGSVPHGAMRVVPKPVAQI